MLVHILVFAISIIVTVFITIMIIKLFKKISRSSKLKKWNNRKKAKILQVGRIDKNEEGKLVCSGFEFDNDNLIPNIAYGPNGEVAICGYTPKEMNEIMSRREEFELENID